MNPVDAIFTRNKPFTYLHTHEIGQQLINDVIALNKTIEIDISCDDNGTACIGHPLNFYDFKELPTPQNLALDATLQQLKNADSYIVIDCKDIRALPLVRSIIKDFGVNRLLFHSWADVLLFKPYPRNTVVEPHWIYEDLPLAALKELHEATGIPLVLSARGLSPQYIADNHDHVVETILGLKGIACAVNFNLPGQQLPPKDIIELLLENRMLTWVNVDAVPESELPSLYLGASDDIVRSSTLGDFK